MYYIGILFHIVIAVILTLYFPVWALVGFAFWLKEIGELKYKYPGSITTIEKNVVMFKESIFDIKILLQWLLPMLVAVFITHPNIFT